MTSRFFFNFSGMALCVSGTAYILDTFLDALAPQSSPGLGVLVPVFGLIGFPGFWLSLRRTGNEGLAIVAYALTMISRLKADWWEEYERWQHRDLSARRFVYIWADGVYFNPRLEEEKQCVLVVIGADEWGRKEVLALCDGYRESTQNWR